MNLSTSLVAIVFFVALGAIVVAQQLEIRSAGYRAGVAEKQLLRGDEQVRVLQAKKAKAEDPRALWETAKAQGIPLVPPEFKEEATAVKKKG